MSEKRLQIWVFTKLFVVFLCAGLYAWGGMENKPLRRYVAPAVCSATMAVSSRSFVPLLAYPPMVGALSIGYGAEDTGTKIIKRLIYGLAVGLSGSIYNIFCAIRGDRKRWILVGSQIVLMAAVSIIFGVFNPFPDARTEETILGLFAFLIPTMSAKRKG